MTSPDPDAPSLGASGRFIRRQREMAKLSVRQLARMSNVSNAYLSQIERGLHEPSIRVLRSVAEALSVPIDDLLQGGSASPSESTSGESTTPRSTTPGSTATSPTATPPDLTTAIQAEPNLTDAQKAALLAVYRGFLEQDTRSDST